LPNGYRTSGLKLPESQSSKRLVWDGAFPKHRHSVAKELEAGAVGYGATGELLAAICCMLQLALTCCLMNVIVNKNWDFGSR